MLAFISFSIGSVLFTNLADKYGRRCTLIFATTVELMGILIFQLAEVNITVIYVVLFCIGLFYVTRNSISNLYGAEFLEIEH